MTPVRNQKQCGDCWAFAAIGAYESSYLIENDIKSSGFSAPSASEQEALDCSFAAYDCKGGWHDRVFDFFVSVGETTKSKYPYTAIKAQCKPYVARKYSAIVWDYVDGANIPSDTAIKAAICSHGPVVAAVNSTNWDQFLSDGKTFAYSTANPKWQHDYPFGVLEPSTPSRPALSTPGNLLKGDIDHDILIIGWDSHGWIIKNSWDTNWGDKGFGEIAYGTDNIGYNAAWIRASRAQTSLSPDVSRALQAVNEGFKAQFMVNRPK